MEDIFSACFNISSVGSNLFDHGSGNLLRACSGLLCDRGNVLHRAGNFSCAILHMLTFVRELFDALRNKLRAFYDFRKYSCRLLDQLICCAATTASFLFMFSMDCSMPCSIFRTRLNTSLAEDDDSSAKLRTS